MKKTIFLTFSFVILTSFVGISVGNLLPTEKQSVEKIFANDRIEIRITNHGGFGADVIGISKLTVKRKNNGKEYRIKYNDKLDGKKSEFKIMNDPLEQLTKRISSLIPGDVKHMQDDIETNIKSLLQSTLTRMNLVTREEFDVQSAVLQRTREKLEQLEKKIEKLK